MDQAKFFFLIFFWIIIFLLGAMVNSGQIVEMLERSSTQANLGSLINEVNVENLSITQKVFIEAIAVSLTWTWTNLLILCCLSSLIGEYGRISMGRAKKYNLISAVIRGFFIYFFIVVGQILFAGKVVVPQKYSDSTAVSELSMLGKSSETREVIKEYEKKLLSREEEFSTDLQNAYIRLAFVCSLCGLVAGMEPEYFKSALNKFKAQSPLAT